jgi:hypothetical protein
MDWQLPLVVVIVAGAAGYLSRQAWRTWSGKKSGCGGGCGCGKTGAPSTSNGSAALIPPEQLTLRHRSQQP